MESQLVRHMLNFCLYRSGNCLFVGFFFIVVKSSLTSTLMTSSLLTLPPPPPPPQVPVASVSSGVHETGKNIDKTEALFSQERDPRFAEMYTSISGCTTHRHTHNYTNFCIHPDSFGCSLLFLFIARSLCSVISIMLTLLCVFVCLCVCSGR